MKVNSVASKRLKNLSFHFVFCVSRRLCTIFWSHIVDVEAHRGSVSVYASWAHILRFYNETFIRFLKKLDVKSHSGIQFQQMFSC